MKLFATGQIGQVPQTDHLKMDFDLIQIDLNDLVVLAAFIWYQQVSVIISQGSNIWVETKE